MMSPPPPGVWLAAAAGVTFAGVLTVELWRARRGRTGKAVWAAAWALFVAALVLGGGEPRAVAGAFALVAVALAFGWGFAFHRHRRAARARRSSRDDGDVTLATKVVALRLTPVAQIMTPADRMTYALETTPFSELSALVRETGHSRVPLLDEPGGHPTGFVHAKDLAIHIHADETPATAADLQREVLTIPPKEPASRLLDAFRHKRIHLAVVTDTLGRALGVVSLGDFYAHLIGSRPDE